MRIFQLVPRYSWKQAGLAPTLEKGKEPHRTTSLGNSCGGTHVTLGLGATLAL